MAGVQSVERAIALLQAVGRNTAGLVDLAEATALPTSTAARLLSTLEATAAVVRQADGTYGIGPAIAGLTRRAGAADDRVPTLTEAAAPHMRALASRFDEAVGLSVHAGSDIATIAQVDAPKPVQAQDWTGSRWPIYAGCSGLVLMATWTADEVAEQLSRRLLALTPVTVTRPAMIRQRIQLARVDGFAWSRGDYVPEVTSVAAAITDEQGRGFATLYVYGPSYRFPPEDQDGAIGDAVLHHAREISREIAVGPALRAS